MTLKTENIAQNTNFNTAAYGMQQILLRTLWLVLFISVCTLIYLQLTRNDVLPINQIKVSGEFKQLLPGDFQSIIETGVKGNFFTVNVGEVYEQIVALPWVEKVWIHRIWPNTLKVVFQEQKPIAILKNKGLINDKGEIFIRETQSFEQQLPEFVVADNYVLDSIKQYKMSREILVANSLKTAVFYFDERKSQKLKLTNGVEIILGRVDIEERLIKFVKAYKMQLQNETRKILKADLRYTNGLAISWRQTTVKSNPLIKKRPV